MSPSPGSKVWVVGLDGASFRLIDPLIAAGRLPTFASIIERGARGVLRSTLPPNSAAGWTAFMTGKNPGKTGVFGFFNLAPGAYRAVLNNGGSVKARRFWEIAGDAGRRVGVINVPFSYPPRPVNGVLVCGMDAPGMNNFTYPADFARELLEVCPEYQIEVQPVKRSPEARKEWFRGHLAGSVDVWWSAFRHIRQRVTPDLLVGVITVTDRVHHWVMDDVYANHPKHSPESASRHGQILPDLYAQIDDQLIRLVESLDEDATLFIISDHGANGFHRRFLINHWLSQREWLFVKKGARIGLRKRIVGHLRRSGWYESLRRAQKAVPRLREVQVSRKTLSFRERFQNIDWERTRAFYLNGYGVRINLEGREANGMVKPSEYEAVREELIRSLRAVRDPGTGATVYAAVHKREEVYHGPYVESGADIVLEEATLHSDARLNFSTSGALRPDRLDQIFAERRLPGDHDLEGILLALGPGIRPGAQAAGARLIDMAPTILYSLGLPVPSDMDGRVLTEMFTEDHLTAHSPTFREQEASPVTPAPAYTEDEELAVQERLQDLGYGG